MKKKGWFALDIDGTLTSGAYSIPKKVISYLKNKHLEGWKIVILTGRSYLFAMSSVANFDFPYILSTQNGSSARHMPTENLIFESFFPRDFFYKIEKETKDSSLALIGYGDDYKCYSKNNDKYNDYINEIVALGNQEKIGFTDISKVKIPARLPLIKLAGQLDEIMKYKDKFEKIDLCESVAIADPFAEDLYMLLLTTKGVNKGSCIEKIKALHGDEGIVIAAGNDHNDLSMFKKADVSIAMEDSPEEVLQTADVIAPSSENHGIIQGLDAAIALAFKERSRI